jgi:plastocyanin
VSVVDFGFDPPEVRIRVGQEVKWKNDGQAGHDLTSRSLEDWSSGALGVAGTYRRVFAQVGVYDYFCTPHPQMRGQIVVTAD